MESCGWGIRLSDLRSTSKDSGYKKVGQVKGKNTKKYEDKTLEAGKTYYYQVRAYKSNSAKNGVASFSKAQKGMDDQTGGILPDHK